MGDYIAETFMNESDPPINDTRLNNLSRAVQDAHTELNRHPTKFYVRLATTQNISLSGSFNIDGVIASTGDRVLVKNQTTTHENGIYVVNENGLWARASDANTSEKVSPYHTVAVQGGYYNFRTEWLFPSAVKPTLGVTGISYIRKPNPAPIAFTVHADAGLNTTATAETRPTGLPIPGDDVGSMFELGLYSNAALSNGRSGTPRMRWLWTAFEYSMFRVVASVIVPGSTNAVIRPQFLQTGGTWQNLTDLPGFGNLSINSLGTKDLGWTYIRNNTATEIRTDTFRFMRFIVEGNTNTATNETMTQLGNVYIMFRG